MWPFATSAGFQLTAHCWAGQVEWLGGHGEAAHAMTTATSQRTHAVGWLHGSTEDQEYENQRPALLAEAKRRGETITEWVELEASAYKGEHLAELTRVQRSFKRLHAGCNVGVLLG